MTQKKEAGQYGQPLIEYPPLKNYKNTTFTGYYQEKFMIIRREFVKYILWRNFIALALYPYIFVRPDVKVNERLLTHERIHLQQQKELTLVVFLVIYVGEWLWLLAGALWRRAEDPWMAAYRNIRFEKEAYMYESFPEYPDKREKGAWRKL